MPGVGVQEAGHHLGQLLDVVVLLGLLEHVGRGRSVGQLVEIQPLGRQVGDQPVDLVLTLTQTLVSLPSAPLLGTGTKTSSCRSISFCRWLMAITHSLALM